MLRKDKKKKLTVVWNAYISGLLGGSGSLNVNRTTTAINQAFTQSPYLKKINVSETSIHLK